MSKLIEYIAIVRLKILRTYDDVVNYVIRELKIRPVYDHQGTTLSGVFLDMNEVEITDTLSTDFETPRISAAVWDTKQGVSMNCVRSDIVDGLYYFQ